MSVKEYLSIGLGAIVAILYIIIFIKNLVKNKSIKKAVEETNATMQEVVELSKELSVQKVKEFCRNAIYASEELYKSIVGKAGAYKLDSVLKDVQIKCIEEGISYDKDFWTEYVKNEVSNMKAVK